MFGEIGLWNFYWSDEPLFSRPRFSNPRRHLPHSASIVTELIKEDAEIQQGWGSNSATCEVAGRIDEGSKDVEAAIVECESMKRQVVNPR